MFRKEETIPSRWEIRNLTEVFALIRSKPKSRRPFSGIFTRYSIFPGKTTGGPKFGLGNRPPMWTGFRARPPRSGYQLRGWHFDPGQVMVCTGRGLSRCSWARDNIKIADLSLG